MRGRRERELEPYFSTEGELGATIRAWRHLRGLTVTDLALQAGFGKNGRGYISKIEHHQIKRLGEEQLAAIAQVLGITPSDLQQNRMPEMQESQLPDKDTLDDAIFGCKAWLKVYKQEDKQLDRARTYLELAELYLERIALSEEREEHRTFLEDALQSVNQALVIFEENGAETSYKDAERVRSVIERKLHIKDLDDAIAGCKALLKVNRQEEQPLNWARTHAKLAQLYRDLAMQSEKIEERRAWLGKALQSIDLALPLFREQAPVSYTQIQEMRLDVEDAREKTLHSS